MKRSTLNSFKGMFTILIISSLLIMLATSCSKKDEEKQTKSFDNFTLADIKAKGAEMVSGDLVISNSTGVLWNPGDVILYVTNQGHYGKFEVISVNPNDNYKLTIKAVTYDTNGSVLVQSSSLAIRGTWLCDLDTMTEIDEGTATEDFWLQKASLTDTNLTAKDTARFLRYRN